jgi:S-adenosylmethionine/arginine decarboxylase-like enzyme
VEERSHDIFLVLSFSFFAIFFAPRHLMFSSHVIFADFATPGYSATILYPPHLTYHTYPYYINASLFIATTSLAVSSMAGKRARVDTLAIATTAPATKRTRVAQRHEACTRVLYLIP